LGVLDMYVSASIGSFYVYLSVPRLLGAQRLLFQVNKLSS
jgi:hypothetical protein